MHRWSGECEFGRPWEAGRVGCLLVYHPKEADGSHEARGRVEQVEVEQAPGTS